MPTERASDVGRSGVAVLGPGAFSKYFRRYGYCSCWTKGDEDCARKNARLRDANGRARSYVYYENEPGRRSDG
jgi:hypothetical protein